MDDFKVYVRDSLKLAHKKLDNINDISKSNKNRLRFHTVQLYALWVIVGSATTGLVSFLIYCKGTP